MTGNTAHISVRSSGARLAAEGVDGLLTVPGDVPLATPLEIARGTQNKILEGMAMGVPVISSRTAARGVDAVVGDHILAATTPDEYIAHISRLFDDEEERDRLAKAGRDRVTSHHNWPRAMTLFGQAIDQCLTIASQKTGTA